MKKLLLATAIAALSVSAANAAPTFYGKAFVTADYVNADIDYDDNTIVLNANNENVGNIDQDANSVQINSNGSRLGLRGSEPMTAATDLIYQLEYGVTMDEKKSLQNRDTFLGVQNDNFGEFRAGHNTSVVDYVNNVTVTEAYWDNLGTTRLEEEKEAQPLNMADSDRIGSSVIWIAPTYNNMPVEVALMYAADEGFYEDSSDRNSGFGASIMFDQGTGFTAGLGYGKDLEIAGDLIRGTISYDASAMTGMPLTLGALYQQADYDGADDDEQGIIISAEMGLANFARPASIYAQYNNTTDLGGADGVDSNQLVVGGKYRYRDNMIMHAYAGGNSVDGNDSFDADVFAIGGGLEYKF